MEPKSKWGYKKISAYNTSWDVRKYALTYENVIVTITSLASYLQIPTQTITNAYTYYAGNFTLWSDEILFYRLSDLQDFLENYIKPIELADKLGEII